MCAASLGAQTAPNASPLERPRTHAPTPTSTPITAGDLRTRLFIFADDSMEGRFIATSGNVKGTDYIAREAKRLGLEPAGDAGTYFQTVPVVTREFDAAASFAIGGKTLEPWKDFAPRDNGPKTRSLNGVPTIYGGVWGDSTSLITGDAAAGKVVIVITSPTDSGSQFLGLPNRPAVTNYFARAAGIMVIGIERITPQAMEGYKQSAIGQPSSDAPELPAYVYITANVARAALGDEYTTVKPGTMGQPFTGEPRFAESPVKFPARNVVGILRGSDPVLRNEFIAIGAHNDHIGVNPGPVAHDSIFLFNRLFRDQGAEAPAAAVTPQDFAKLNAQLAEVRRKTSGASARPDSIANGADDDGSGSVSVLELAEYFAGQRTRPKRSLLFVWHVGEEVGLWGSEYFTDHPTVSRDSIVAQLNIDMIGRGGTSDATGATKAGEVIHGGPNYLQVIGSRRLSTELGDLVDKVNADKKHGFTFDYALDADGHPQNIYCRSDHYSYARYGIPIAFFTTGGHADYHQVTDEPQYIDFDHMARVVSLIKDIAVAAGNLDHRLVVDKAKPDPHGACKQ
jgi:hypothetical protein